MQPNRGLLQLVAYGPIDYYFNSENNYAELQNIYHFGWNYMISFTKENLINDSRIKLANGYYGEETQKMKKIIDELEKQSVPEEVLRKKREDLEILCGLRPWPNQLWWTKPKWIIRKLKGEI